MTSPQSEPQQFSLLERVILAAAVVVGLTGTFIGGDIRWVLLGVALVMIGIEALLRRRRLARTPPPTDTGRRP